MNLGGPERPQDVKGFLFRLFADPEVIRIRFTPLRLLVAWAIATAREKTSRALYATIGGGSPIRRLTDRQSASLEALLRARTRDVTVRTAFTCSPPLVEDVVREAAAEGVRDFLVFPLYPQYSFTTTRGSLDRARAAVARFARNARLNEISSWPEQASFVRAHAELIREAVARFSDPRPENIHLLFSAHSIPEKLVTEGGDPYRAEMEKTVAAVVKELGWAGSHGLAWQSKLGPVKWLEPSTLSVLGKLGREGRAQVLAVPIAFVTDHIETLNEMDILFRDAAAKAGIREFRRTPGLNDHPTFIKALEELALSQSAFWEN